MALGCSKNMVDSEMILGSLLENGWVLTGETDEADLVVVNTCGFSVFILISGHLLGLKFYISILL